ncbi:hypothetical protein FRC11_002149 [Ceratobasidium sp. 423]|nr:hypothetical protein FRC11_002149 [Ceratobasidium sp. 423]
MDSDIRSRFQELSPQEVQRLTELRSKYAKLFSDGGSSVVEHDGHDAHEVEDQLEKAFDRFPSLLWDSFNGIEMGLMGVIKLGELLSSCFERTLNLVYLDLAIRFLSRAGDHFPLGLSNASIQALDALSKHLLRRFKELQDWNDIDKAVECHARVFSVNNDGLINFAAQLGDLGSSFADSFGSSRNMDHLNTAIECTLIVPPLVNQNENKLVALHNLATWYLLRFEQQGSQDDILQAIKLQSEVLSPTPEGSPRIAQRTSKLGEAYLCRYQLLGELEDIDRAIGYLIQALLAVDPENIASLPAICGSCGAALMRRFERLGIASDINRAINLQSMIVGLLGINHIFLNNLAASYLCRFIKFKLSSDLDMAIKYQSEALTSAPDGNDLSRATYLSNLGCAYMNRFVHLGQLEDIDQAIAYQAQAVSLTPEGHFELPVWLINLGISHTHRFGRTNWPENINRAVEYLSRSVSLTPDSHSELAFRCFKLGIAYQARFEALDDHISLELALDSFRKSAQSPMGHPQTKLTSAEKWAHLAPPSSPQRLQAFQTAMELIPELVWLGMPISKRYSDVWQIGKVSIDAAAAAIDSGRHTLALEWLEQGRSVVWNQILQLRSPLDELYAAHPSLAEKMHQVSEELRNHKYYAEKVSRDVPHWEPAARKQHRLAEKYARLIETIRQLPGFQNFLLPKEADELVSAARDGPVVVINIQELRCDALIIRPGFDDITHVPFPNLSHQKIHKAHTRMDRSYRYRTASERSVGERGVRPVQHESGDGFEEMLDLLEPTSDDLPRITWCTTGIMSLLPLHAAGRYDRPGAKVSDFVVSSYTPTLSALLSAGAKRPPVHSRLLAIGQASTPGHLPLPGTKDELASLEACCATLCAYTQLEGDTATTGAVLSAMKDHDWVHLACHAHQNVKDPVESGFFLHDGTLSLAAITKEAFTNKGLAFLSACQTATGDRSIPDESVHLAAGMLTAGYPSVIATMWSVRDSDAPFVAKRVYTRLLKNARVDYREAARALHGAVNELRTEIGDKQFHRWVPYIHFGI